MNKLKRIEAIGLRMCDPFNEEYLIINFFLLKRYVHCAWEWDYEQQTCVALLVRLLVR